MSGSRAESLKWLKVVFDLFLSSLALLAAYAFAALGFPFSLSKGLPELQTYLKVLPIFWAIFLFSSVFFRLYRPRPTGSFFSVLIDLLKVNIQAWLIILAAGFYFRDQSYSRVIVTSFISLNFIILSVHHYLWMYWEVHLARNGIGTKPCLIIGSGELANEVASRMQQHLWTGLDFKGFLNTNTDSQADDPKVDPELILGDWADFEKVLSEHDIREVLVALSLDKLQYLHDVDEKLSQTTIGLRWIPDLEAINTLHQEVNVIDDLHFINLRGLPMNSFSYLLKRSLDIVLSFTLLVLFAPFLAVIACLIRVSSAGPILYRQERVGLDGCVFTLLKFRTMRQNAEAKCGPVWTKNNDDRCTGLGRMLRRSSIDELPQLFNVLVGNMSLVGPRPERPVFIEEFRQTIPRYMLRHRMKAGLTGWAQVNGWRGNTSLKKRIQFDLYYLKHWTLWFDLKILVLTLFRSWGKRWNAY